MSINSMGRFPTNRNHLFSEVPEVKIQRSSFNRSQTLKTTFDSGYLVPIYCDEALPGDTFSLKCTTFARLSTPIKPVMDNLYIDVFFFAVPERILWTNFVKMMGEQTNPGDSISYICPTITSPASGPAVGSISDYIGVPTVGQIGGGNTITFRASWHRAYNKIYNQWFRDQNLINSVADNMGDGPDTYTDYSLLKAGKRHDYFTSCLPWPQKGTAASIPLGTSAPVIGDGTYTINLLGQTSGKRGQLGSTSAVANTAVTLYNQGAGNFANAENLGFDSTGTYTTGLKADLTNATAATINSLRLAFQTQKFLERDARGGTRFTEVILSHFGVTNPDFRLQRPEYLGGGTDQINFFPVAQTQGTGASGTTTAQGNLAGMAVHSGSGHGFTKSFTEHMVIMGLARVRADLNYQQGLHRMFSRSTRYDFFWPEFAHLGEQAVLNKEIFADGSGNDANTFGYQERYAEYRYGQNKITGKFRSTASGTLDIWHCAQKFTSLPTLNSTFINEAPPIDRIVAVNSEPQILLDAYFDVRCARPMPVYSVPGYIDRF